MPTKRNPNASGEYTTPSEPTTDDDANKPQDDDGFESPGDESALAADAAQAESDAFLQGVDSQLLGAKAELEKVLAHLAGDSEGLQSQAAMEANIVGVGIGLGNAASGGVPGEPVLEVYTIESEAASETRARLAGVAGISALSDADFPIHVVHTGVIDAFAHRMRMRPAPGGISVGHFRVTAGTLGCLVRGRQAPRNARLMVLSNNHVLANSNTAAIGEAILQPGSFDGGKNPGDQIAVLERFVRINFAGGNNLVDAATGWAWSDRVRREQMYISGGVVRYYSTGGVPVGAVPGMTVGKSGRTTQLTSGRVTAVGVTVNVNYGAGRVARFVNQIAVRAGSGDFSQGGDSGSLIWTWDARRAPVGLLFAGGGGTTFANRIGDALNALDVNMVV